VATLRPGQDLEPFLTEADHQAFEAEMEAAARGDARAALQHHLSGLIVEESIHPHRLREIVDLAEDAPGWVYSRWCVDQAYRWMLMNKDPRTDDMIRIVLAVAHLDHVEPLLEKPTEFTEYGTLVAACDWLVEQLCVYTAGGLRDFLEVRADPALLARADRIEEWVDATWGVYRLQELRGSVVVVRDLVHETDLELLNTGAFVDQSDVVLGRVVPISDAPFLMFDSRPVPLDEEIARQAAIGMRGSGPLAVLDAISRAREEHRLERGFSCHGITLYSNDIVPEPRQETAARREVPGRLRELLALGLDEYVANGVMVAEVALITAKVSGERTVVGPHLMAVLTSSRIFAAVSEHCVEVRHESAWRSLAAVTASPTRERCERLAELCRDRAA
jgi:hypothetical protein